MKIYFERQGTQVLAKVVVAIPGYEARTYSLAFDCGSNEYAGLLTEAMRVQLQSEIENIRQDEYQDGWSMKAAHKKGPKQWFASTLQWRNRK